MSRVSHSLAESDGLRTEAVGKQRRLISGSLIRRGSIRLNDSGLVVGFVGTHLLLL